MFETEKLLADALRVLVLDPRTAAHLRAFDPTALDQGIRAVATYEAELLNAADPESIRLRANYLYDISRRPA
jgi:hypothetical protein